MNWLQKLHRWLRRRGTPRVIITDGDHRFHAYVTRKDGRLYARTTRGLEELHGWYYYKLVGRHTCLNSVDGRPGATWEWESDDED